MKRSFGLILMGFLGAAALAATGRADDSAAVPDDANESDDLVALIARVQEAYGGQEALDAFEGFRARGKVLSLADGVNGRLRLELSLAGDLRTEIVYPQRTEVRILAGPLGWNGGRRHQRVSAPKMAASMRLQYHRLAAPFELVRESIGKLAREDDSPEGWIRIRRDWNSNERTIYEIDPETGRILRITGEVGSGDDTLLFETSSHDFREINGVLFPFRMTTIVGGQVAAETILDRLVPEGDFPPTTFLPAGAAGDM